LKCENEFPLGGFPTWSIALGIT